MIRSWRRITAWKTRSRIVIMAFSYTLLVLSVCVYYIVKTHGHSQDPTTWRQSRFYNSMFAFGQKSTTDDTSVLQKLVGERREMAPPGGEVDIKDKSNQQLILRSSGGLGIVGQSGETNAADDQRTFDTIKEVEIVNEFVENLDPKNRTSGHSQEDSRLPVTTAIDVTTIHFINATVKPTPPPEIDGYYNIQSDQKLRLHCSQCALVSSSGHLLNSSAGEEIDSYPCVLRMNSAPVSGYEADVGSKTTIRIVGHVNLKVLNASDELQEEILRNKSSRAEKVIVPWLYNVKLSKATDIYYRSAQNLSKLYPDVDFYLLTPEKMQVAESLFHTETGLTRQEARTWLSTGWMSMLFAVDVCDKVDVFGLVPENHCAKHPNASALYHYYEADGLKECDYYKTSEERLTSGHKFITEKAVFARWATKFNIEFHIPAWNITGVPPNNTIETPFLKRFYEAKKNGTLPKLPTGSRIIRKVVRRVVKKVIVRRKVPVVQKKPQS